MPAKPNTNHSQSVLIIDRSEDTSQVLRTVLERRGVQIFDTRHAGTGLKLAQRMHPTLIILDWDVIPADDPSIRDGLDHETESTQTPIVVLGNIRKSEAILPHYCVVPTPYHYGPLIRKIEQLLTSPETSPG